MITRCTSRPQFLATFGRFVDETSIFVATHQPRPCGVTLPFAIALEDGETMLRGDAEVVESRTEADGAHRRPGMRLRIVHLDSASRATHAELLSSTRAGTAPPPIPVDVSTRVDRDKVERSTPPPETRVPGSSYIVPANPFTQLPDEALEYFIECTLYEEASMQPEARDGMVPPVPFTAGSSDTMAPVAPMASVAGAPVQATIEVEPLPSPRRRGYRTALIAMIGATIGLAGGFILWGLRQDATAPAALPALETAATKPTPALAPPPVESPAAKPAALATAAKPAGETAVETPTPKPTTTPGTTPGTTSPASPGCHASIVTEPADAPVRIDGTLAGRTPLDNLALSCGDHLVLVEHPRYERVERHLSVADGAAGSIELRLARPAGLLQLQSSPPGATFTVDGAPAGHAPATAHVQAFTFVKVKASLEGYGTWTQRVYVLSPRMALTAPLEPGRRALKSQAKPQL